MIPHMVPIEKLAAPRYEREIAAGNIPRSAVTPGVPDLPGPFGAASRALSRQQLAAPAPRSPEEVARTRQMNEKRYAATLAHPPEDVTVKGMHLPGMGPMTHPTGGGGGKPAVFSGPDAGQLIRGVHAPDALTRAKTLAGIVAPQAAPHLFPAKTPADSTLNQAILQHELGEASEVHRRQGRPFASHLGAEPILRENLHSLGDPEAQRVMADMRTRHPDDAMVQRFIRQAGGTPDAPLPIGGKAQRAVEGMIDRNVMELQPKTRMQAWLKQQAGIPVSYLPKDVPSLPHMVEKGQAIREAQGLGGKWNALKEFGSTWNNLRKFVK